MLPGSIEPVVVSVVPGTSSPAALAPRVGIVSGVWVLRLFRSAPVLFWVLTHLCLLPVPSPCV